ncbi:dnaJ-like protein 60 [Condylostylus longicornis]|uniref:dnaJ-like protein 60 n=1 Tax=Condylostylus longicornis TaxID=2530218 RepID=UPI00244E1E91|nr:dnaJ-like protein 60 [Condylostylus longicornis]
MNIIRPCLHKYRTQFPIIFWLRHLNAQRSDATYYDVLNLKRNCTTEEIRNAFIKLSKEHHPDVKSVQNDPKATAKYVLIKEAYQVLSKKASRREYDQDLAAKGFQNVTYQHAQGPWKVYPNYNENPGPYYGVEGWQRISNLKFVWILLAFATVFTALEFYLVRNSFTFDRKRLDELSKEASNLHESVRADAVKYGNDKQLERVIQRILKDK